MIFQLRGQTLYLDAKKAIFWEEQRTIFLADVHLGKAAHFRKQGLAAPHAILHSNINNLRNLFDLYQPDRVFFLGDLFHSSVNYVWGKFVELLHEYPEIQFELVQGNHDILPAQLYAYAQLEVHKKPVITGPFLLSHYPLKNFDAALYNLCGHIHPGVMLHGFKGQQLRFPCFHFKKKQAILPAFGAFTGLANVEVSEADQVFVIAEDEILKVN